MLGSSTDSDDLVQETLLRAWKARSGLRDATSVRAWLYRIATNACLDELARRPRRAMPFDLGPAAAPSTPIAPAASEATWLEPMPGAWLDHATDPRETCSRRESIALAFVAALQWLTPIQRAVLLLRDVAELSANETATALNLTVSAANSALFRAREAVHARHTTNHGTEIAPGLLSRYMQAFEQADVNALLSLLRDDIRTSMPPSPTWIDGRDANIEFYERMFAGLPERAIRMVPTSANGQPAFGFYRAASAGGPHLLRAIHVVTVESSVVSAIDHFMMPSLGPAFGLAASLLPL
ncbi:MAG: polymerase sigma factor [Myxococcales bacterium]|nr:polymerase sigma factor [Myxococcales bacterium]